MPTLKELGHNIEFYLWVGMFAPKGTPDAAVNALREAAKQGGCATTSSCRPCATSARTWPISTSPSSRTFWEADAQRVEDAVRQIGKV